MDITALDAEYKKTQDAIDVKYKDVFNIDEQISRLFKKRRAVMFQAYDAALSYIANQTFPKVLSAYDNYKTAGFADAVVKETVNAIRKIFFDDTDKAYRDFSCSNISRDGAYVNFEFISNKYDKGFSIGIPHSPEETVPDMIINEHISFGFILICSHGGISLNVPRSPMSVYKTLRRYIKEELPKYPAAKDGESIMRYSSIWLDEFNEISQIKNKSYFTQMIMDELYPAKKDSLYSDETLLNNVVSYVKKSVKF